MTDETKDGLTFVGLFGMLVFTFSEFFKFASDADASAHGWLYVRFLYALSFLVGGLGLIVVARVIDWRKGAKRHRDQ